MRIFLGSRLARAGALESNTWVGPAMVGGSTALYLSQERWGRVRLHFVAALRAGHWGWHFAGIAREIECIWPQTYRALATANGSPEPSNNRNAKPT